MVSIEWTKDALADLERLDRNVSVRIVKKLSWFAENFNNIIPEPLSGMLKGT